MESSTQKQTSTDFKAGMFYDPVFWLLFAVGALIGILSIPWKHTLDNSTSAPTWILLWACFSPFLVMYISWFGLRKYRDAWSAYLEPPKGGQNETVGFTAHETVKQTFFKPRDR